MDNKLAVLAAVVTTLDETGPAPASAIYLGLGCDMHAFESVVGVLVNGGLVTRTPSVLTITPKGRELAAEINKIIPCREQ